MGKELETADKLLSFSLLMGENMVGLSKCCYDENYFIKKTREYLDKYRVDRHEASELNKALINKSKTEQVLGIILELLDKCCKIYLIDGKTYYQIQIKVMHGDYTFGMSITKEEYYLLKEVLSNDSSKE